MSQTIQPAYVPGQLVTQSTMQSVQDASRNLVGSAVAGILGITSANFMDVPFTVASVGGMSVAAGGSGGQKILVNSASGSRLVDAIPSQTFTVPTANGTNPRNDILYGVYAQAQILASNSGQIATLSGGSITVSSGNIYNATEAITYTYVTGTAASSPTDPSGPANSVALARIVVPAGATSINSSNITVLLTTAQAQILSGLSGYVDLTTDQTAAGNKTFSGVTTIGGIEFAHTDAAFSGVPGVRRNGPNSILINPADPGHTINLGFDDTGMLGIYFGPGNLWGSVTSSGFNSPTGFSVPNAGQAIASAIQFGNPSAGGAVTTIGSGSGNIQSIVPEILLIANENVAPLLALDHYGNLGLLGGINCGSSVSIIGNLGVSSQIQWGGGTLYASGEIACNGPIFIGSAQIATIFESTDSSLNIANSSGVVNITLPGGVINSYSSPTSTVAIVQPGGTRTLQLDVSTGLTLRVQQRIAASGSITLTLPTLPSIPGSHTWILYAEGTADLGSGSVYLAGSGASWEAGQTTFDDGVSGAQTIQLIGTAVGGQAPSATYNLPNLGGGGGGIFFITATLQ